MDEARAVVADFCEKNPYLLGALPMTWFGCGPFARMVVAGVIYELRLVITRALAIADREDNKKYVELVCDTYRHWPVRVVLWGLLMVMFLMPFIYMAEVAVAQVIAHVIHNLEVVMALTTALKIPRKWSWTLKATAIALRGTLHSVTASAPLVAWGMFFFATIEPFHLADSATKKTAKSVLAAPVKIPLNILRGRSPFHGIAGIGEKDDKKKEEPPVATATEAVKAAAAPAAVAPAPAPAPKKKKWFWQKEIIPEANPEEKIKPAPAWAVYAMLVVWYGAALVLNGTFRSALVQDLGARGAKEAIAAEARMKMGL